ENDDKQEPEPISESGRIFIRNLSYTCTEDDLRELFEKFGTITELHMPIDSYTKKPKDSQNKTRWNTLFVRANAVADIMSKNLNMNKLDLLTKSDRKSGTAAVRMALGEAQIVNEIKQFLMKNQVHLESFERGMDCPRSRTTILVKNLPADTQEQEIRELFEKYGLINRVILPPYGLTAIIEMQEPNEAKFAFKKLAYTNFKHYPLYLEWAPEDVFAGNPSSTTNQSIPEEEKPMDEIPIEDGSTIFVKNLNFDTNEQDFREYFENKIGPVHSATIATKKSPKGILSMGYGFVQFYQSKMAKEAIKKLQNSKLDGHQIEIKLSNRSAVVNNNNEMPNNKKIGKT
ncbi:RNA-binding protein 19-like protein, partial [Euroglyphus maynei]